MSVSMPNSCRAETLISGMPDTFSRAAVVVEAITCPTKQSPPNCGSNHSRRPICALQAANWRGCPEKGSSLRRQVLAGQQSGIGGVDLFEFFLGIPRPAIGVRMVQFDQFLVTRF